MSIVFNQIIFLFKVILILPVYSIYRLTKMGEDIWLVGENTGKCLGDNGYVFYQYCRKYRPDRDIYLIVNKQSRFAVSSVKDANVVYYSSFRHILKFMLSTVCIYSHVHSDIAYKQIFKLFKSRKTKKIFLQHGVIGIKRLGDIYNRNSNEMDIFVLSSEYEKNIVKKCFDFDSNTLNVTGLARYDQLIANKSINNKILYIPTWRKKSDARNIQLFINRVSSLLQRQELLELLESYDCTLTFYAHERMEEYMEDIHASRYINIARPGDKTVQHLLLEHSLMITDYSSVSWDFLYMEKPVLFYQFDQDRYMQEWGSYMDLNKDLFGEVSLTEDEILSSLRKHLVNKQNVLPEYSGLRNKYFKYHDTNNCQRIYEAIVHICSTNMSV